MVSEAGPNRGTRLQTLVAVAVLLLLPVGLGVGLGWYGLNPTEQERLSPVASYAHELLSGFPDGRLVVEIASPPGDAPPMASVALLWSRMNETLDKTSITFQLETYPGSSRGALSDQDLFSLEAKVRQTWPTYGTMSLFYLFVQGTYGGGPGVIGLAFRGSSIAVFPTTVTGGAAPTSQPGIFSTVLVHEFGHEIGLVGLVGSAPNEDPDHPGHSTDPNDVMYWQVETTAVLGGLLGGASPPTQFDGADLSDLGTVRSTPIPTEILPWVVLTAVLIAAVAVVVGPRLRRRTVRPASP